MLERILEPLLTLVQQTWASTWLALPLWTMTLRLEASQQEIIRRYYQTILDVKAERVGEGAVKKIELLMNDLGINPNDRKVTVLVVRKKKKQEPALALLNSPNGETGNRKPPILWPNCSPLINAIKKLAHIDKEPN